MPYASPERKKERDREYYKNLSEKQKRARRKYNREYQRRIQLEDPERRRAASRRWNARHPELKRLYYEKQPPEYAIWLSIKQRCCNPNSNAFHLYGARGIEMCKRWQKSFRLFLKDMGPRPEGYQIDRINFNGNYCPSNCRWVTTKEQARNKRTNIFIEFEGKRQCLMDWSIETGIKFATLRGRVKRGLNGQELFA